MEKKEIWLPSEGSVRILPAEPMIFKEYSSRIFGEIDHPSTSDMMQRVDMVFREMSLRRKAFSRIRKAKSVFNI
jgi:hypothetical protein